MGAGAGGDDGYKSTFSRRIRGAGHIRTVARDDSNGQNISVILKYRCTVCRTKMVKQCSGGIPNRSGCLPITDSIIDHRTLALIEHCRSPLSGGRSALFQQSALSFLSPFAFHDLASLKLTSGTQVMGIGRTRLQLLPWWHSLEECIQNWDANDRCDVLISWMKYRNSISCSFTWR